MKKLCTFAGCRAVVQHPGDNTSPRCPKHTVSNNHTYTREDAGRQVYDTARWKRIRARKIALNPLCEVCERMGLVNPADVVDHIKEIKDGGEQYDMSNLMSMCHTHHNKKTGKVKVQRKSSKNSYRKLSDF